MKLVEKIKGWHYALACYVIWGSFPIYWYPLRQSAMPAEQLLAQRVVWSAIFALLLIIYFKQVKVVVNAFKTPKILGIFFLSSCLVGLNWLVYLWAIVHNRVIDASLGYFINPLLNVFLGWLLLKENINKQQVIALIFAIIGILWLAIPAGQIPYIAILLASSFGFYGLIRKIAPMEALAGLALETFLLFPFALSYLIYCFLNNNLVFQELNSLQTIILLGSGAATTIPLIWFAMGARQISLSLLGMLQYISPTLQFLCGLLIFKENFSVERLIGYILVWIGVAIFLFAMKKKT